MAKFGIGGASGGPLQVVVYSLDFALQNREPCGTKKPVLRTESSPIRPWTPARTGRSWYWSMHGSAYRPTRTQATPTCPPPSRTARPSADTTG